MTLFSSGVAGQHFVIPVAPTAKGRPRFRRTAKFVQTYTPKETADAETAIRFWLSEHGARLYPLGVPLRVELRFGVARPATAPRRVIYPAKRPDLDQFVKLALDAGNGILWSDDAQIVTIIATKLFGTPPFVEVDVAPLTGAEQPKMIFDTAPSGERGVSG